MPDSNDAENAFNDAVQFWTELLAENADPGAESTNRGAYEANTDRLRIKVEEYAIWAGISYAAAARQVRNEAQRRRNA